MEARDLLPYRTPLIGGLIALTVGVTFGLALRTGAQEAPSVDSYALADAPYAAPEPIAWPSGKIPDYVIGTDFVNAQHVDPPPVVVASYEVPEYVAPIAWREPEPQAQPVRLVEPSERTWASTSGDILNVRLPEDAPAAPAPPQALEASEAPVAVAAPVAMASY